MKKELTIISSILICISSYAKTETTLCINEIMQSDIDSYMTEHDFPDSWIELYNPTDQDIDLYHYYISKTVKVSEGYQLPTHTTISAKGYLLIYCDKMNTGLHTNFKLESADPGAIYVFNSSKTLVCSLTHDKMLAPNVAYGRTADGEDSWGWELLQTPGAANSGGTSNLLLPAPIFSKAGHVMSGAETITITMPAGKIPEDTKIYVTTDGSEPNLLSTSGTSFSYKISESTVLRAKLISSSAISQPSTTHSYIFHPRSTKLPIISLATDDSYLYSDENGILSEAITDGQVNYKYDWRRPVNAEYLGIKGEAEGFNQIGEVAIGGSVSRGLKQKTFKLYANKRFGTKKLKGQFWSEKPNVTKVKSFALRNGGNSSSSIRFNDAMMQRMFGTHVKNLDYQAYSPAIVYINGKYNGIVGLRERSNEDYVESNYDGLENIEMGTQLSYMTWKTGVEERSATSFKDVYSLYNKSATTYDQMAAVIDVDNFMKTMITEMYAANSDWPHNNISMWRDLENNGKWRWILKDLDFWVLAENSEFDMFKYIFGTAKNGDQEYELANRSSTLQAVKLYRKMMSYPQFKEAFIDACATYLGDFLKPTLNSAIVDEMYAEIQKEIEPTFAVFDYDTSILEDWFRYFKSCQVSRSGNFYHHMADYFSLGDVIPMNVQPYGANITINDNGLSTDCFDGAYFSDRTLRLNSGDSSLGWKMTTYHKDANNTMVKNSKVNTFKQQEVSLKLKDYSNCDSVVFTTYTANETEFSQKLNQLGIKPEKQTDLSSNADISLSEPQYAYANLTGISKLPTSKEENLHAYIDFYDNNGKFFHKKVLVTLQGNASTIKNNISLAFCEDDWIGEVTTNLTFGKWVTQDEFHLKAFYEDGLRGTAEVAYNVYAVTTQRKNCYPQAFPLSLYVNGKFYGVMAWQLKKHRDVMGLDKKTATNVWLDGTLNDKQIFQGNINWTKFEVRNPKDLYNTDGTEYDGDNPQELMDTKSATYDSSKGKMVRTVQAKQYITSMSKYCKELKALEDKGTKAAAMQTAIKARFDVTELINYMIFSLITNNYDGFSKNWQWFTYDGVKWTVAPYDCNRTFGYNEEGTTLWPATQSSKKYDYKMENIDSDGPMYWIKNYFWDDLKSRYAQLRKSGTISPSSIMNLVSSWHDRIGEDNYKEEWKKWPESPCVCNFADNTERFRTWVNLRIALEDVYLGYQAATSSYTFSISSSKWITLCLPFSYKLPKNVSAYTITGVQKDGVTLELKAVSDPLANTPYILYGPAGQYTVEGEISDNVSTLNNGLLCGTLIDTYAPADTYVLQDRNKIVGFYHVSTDETMPVNAYHAYLTTKAESRLGHFRFPDETSGLNSIYSESETTTEMFNYLGQPVDSNEASGIYIQRMPDGSCRKIFIRK